MRGNSPEGKGLTGKKGQGYTHPKGVGIEE